MKINQIQNLIGAVRVPAVPASVQPQKPIVEGNLALADNEPMVNVSSSSKQETGIKVQDQEPSIVVRQQRQDDASVEAIRTFVKANLIDGKDYGNIPGVPHKVLFKTGAIKILHHLRYRHHDELIDKTIDIPNGFIGYSVKVTIIGQDGEVITEGIGSANSLEAKFAKQGFSGDRLLVAMACKRALICAVKELL